MIILIAILLGIIGLSFVLYPLYRPVFVKVPSRRTANEQTSLSVNAIGEREQAARSALQEVELDYQLGNISDEDYNTLRERYVRRVLRALKLRHEQDKKLAMVDGGESMSSEDEQNGDYDSDIDEMIEQELQRLREQAKQGNKEDDAAN